MNKVMITFCVVALAIAVNARDRSELYGVWQHTQQSRADPNSNWNKRMNFLQNWCTQNVQQNGGVGFQPQDPMSAAGQQIGRELAAQIQWFDNFGEMALVNNRMEYQARLVRLMQIRQMIANAAGHDPRGVQVVSALDVIINMIRERFNKTAPQNQPIGSATPRFA